MITVRLKGSDADLAGMEDWGNNGGGVSLKVQEERPGMIEAEIEKKDLPLLLENAGVFGVKVEVL